MKFPASNAEYAHLKTWNEPWGIVYGPVQSRRLGKSLGINLLGSSQKACSFDCLYCELGRTELRMKDLKDLSLFPSLEEVASAVRERFRKISEQEHVIDSINIVGNGEPTLYPQFEEAVKAIKELRDQWLPKVKIGIFTNGSTLDNKHVVAAMNLLDERYIKLDGGSEAIMKNINAPLVRMSLQKLIAGTRKLKDVTLQCIFVQGVVDNTQTRDIEEWIEVVGMIKPKAIHLYSMNRVPPTSGLKKVEEETMDRIAAQLERRTKIRALVFA
jgi:wyosine [tRNA(Phe)-imidazoG37] synthetase (radical SAM superfamily)